MKYFLRSLLEALAVFILLIVFGFILYLFSFIDLSTFTNGIPLSIFYSLGSLFHNTKLKKFKDTNTIALKNRALELEVRHLTDANLSWQDRLQDYLDHPLNDRIKYLENENFSLVESVNQKNLKIGLLMEDLSNEMMHSKQLEEANEKIMGELIKAKAGIKNFEYALDHWGEPPQRHDLPYIHVTGRQMIEESYMSKDYKKYELKEAV